MNERSDHHVFEYEQSFEFTDAHHGLRHRTVLDTQTGMVLTPFVSAREQVDRAIAAELSLSDNEIDVWRNTGKVSEAVMRFEYTRLYRDKSAALFEISHPDDGYIGLVGAANPIVRQGAVYESILIGNRDSRRKGYATMALTMLYCRLAEHGLYTALARIHPNNISSWFLHEQFTKHAENDKAYGHPWQCFAIDTAKVHRAYNFWLQEIA